MLLVDQLRVDQLSEPGWGWCAAMLVNSVVSMRREGEEEDGSGKCLFLPL